MFEKAFLFFTFIKHIFKMAKNKEIKNDYSDFSNPLQFRVKLSNVDVNQKVGRFGEMKKNTADFTFDEMVEFYLNMSPKSRDVFFIGVIPPNYKSPFDVKSFPKSPLEYDRPNED